MSSRPLLLLALLFAPSALSQEEPAPLLRNEFIVGIGATFPREKDPLNLFGENPMPVSFAVNIGYRRYLTEQFAVGLRAFGTTNRLHGYVISRVPGTAPYEETGLDLTTITAALEGVWLLSPPDPVQPYAFLMVGYAGGVLSGDFEGSLEYHGVTGGGGVGLRCDASPAVSISLEGIASFGGAHWREAPSAYSYSARYDPSTFLALLTVSIRTQ